MLKLTSNGGAVINTDDFYITYKASGVDELTFNLSIHDENYPKIVEEAAIEYEQPYLVKAIDAGAQTAKIKCQLNLDGLKETMYPDYSNKSATLAETVTGVLPAGWLFLDNSYSVIKRTIEGGYTPYDVIMECIDTYSVVFRFDVRRRRIIAYDVKNFEPLGAFASTELNLKEINYKGKSTEFCTRLYGYGKKGLSFADINGGKPYVDNFQYTDKVICAYWQDDRYEVKESLLEDAKKKLEKASIPERAYECSVMDLAKTNPEMYSFQDFSLFAVIKLIDDIKDMSINYQVVEYQEYPFYPEKNVVTLSSTAPKIQSSVKELKNEITNQSSGFWNIMHNAIDSATDWITGVNGGYVIFHKDENDIPYEILIMDTPDIATAKNVWRWNQNGFGHSSNGYNGPYDLAMTIDGAIVANFITAGTMLADRIRGGLLEIGGASGINGVIRVLDSEGNEIGRWSKTGLDVKSGNITGTTIILGGKDNAFGLLKLLSGSGVEIVRLDEDGVYAKGKYVCEGGTYKRNVEISDGAFRILDSNGKEIGKLIATSDKWMRLECGRVGIRLMENEIYLDAPNIGPDGYKGKTGRAVFSDGSYLDFRKGFLTGGQTADGGTI